MRWQVVEFIIAFPGVLHLFSFVLAATAVDVEAEKCIRRVGVELGDIGGM